MKIESDAFENNSEIPLKYGCKGENVNPGLNISGIPEETKTIALIMDDPDAPMGTFVHWIVFNFPVSDSEVSIGEDSVPNGKQGTNDFKKIGYGGPCPPSGTHQYFFKAYALDSELDLGEGCSKNELEESMKGHVLDNAELIGKYSKD